MGRMTKWSGTVICIPESFNSSISHQLFDYTITFVNSQLLNTNSKGGYVLKTGFKVVLKDFWYKRINPTPIW